MKHIAFLSLAVLCLAAAPACSRKEPDAAGVATPSVTLNHERAPLGSPVDITYKFVVANDAKFDDDYRV